MSRLTPKKTISKIKYPSLEDTKERIINEEKDALKREVEAINKRVETEELTYAEGEQLKKEAAERRALNIENKLAIVNNKIALLERNGDLNFNDRNTLSIDFLQEGGIVNFDFDSKGKRKYDRRTTSDLVVAIGLNNAITKGESLGDSDFKIAGSRFFELGIAWKTRVFKESNWLRVKYGFSFQWNGLKPTDNRYFMDTGAETELVVHPEDLDKSKFRMDNLVFPVHLEFGPSNKIENEDYFRYNTYNKIKVGVGGYAGFKLGSRQKLRFNMDGEEIKQKLKSNYNTNNFIYGVSAYVGWRGLALYAKYDLNTIFKDNPIEQRNVSLGLRFDMD